MRRNKLPTPPKATRGWRRSFCGQHVHGEGMRRRKTWQQAAVCAFCAALAKRGASAAMRANAALPSRLLPANSLPRHLSPLVLGSADGPACTCLQVLLISAPALTPAYAFPTLCGWTCLLPYYSPCTFLPLHLAHVATLPAHCGNAGSYARAACGAHYAAAFTHPAGASISAAHAARGGLVCRHTPHPALHLPHTTTTPATTTALCTHHTASHHPLHTYYYLQLPALHLTYTCFTPAPTTPGRAYLHLPHPTRPM